MIKDKKDIEYQAAVGLSATTEIMRWRHENEQPWVGAGEFHVDLEFHVHDLIKRDVDNLAKNVLDGMSTIVFDDDKQVVSMSVTKRLNRKSPRTIVTVYKVEGFLAEHVEAGVGLGQP